MQASLCRGTMCASSIPCQEARKRAGALWQPPYGLLQLHSAEQCFRFLYRVHVRVLCLYMRMHPRINVTVYMHACLFACMQMCASILYMIVYCTT